jgi:cysteine desulfuration protein SufE
MPRSISEIEQDIISEFATLDDQMMRYEYIIELGKALPPLPEQYKTAANLVKGCQSLVWLHTEVRDGRVYFEADSNAFITKGLIAMLVRVLSGQKPGDIVDAKLEFIDAIQLRAHLTEGRSNGLTAMIARMKKEAVHSL